MNVPAQERPTFPPVVAGGLVLVLLLSTLGEGGAAPTAMRAWHTALVCLVLLTLLSPSRPALAAGPAIGLALFAACVLIGALLVPGYSAWLQLLELAAFLAVVGLAARCGAELLRWIGPALLLCGVAQSVALLALGSGPDRPAGTFLNANHLAGWLGAGLMLVLGELLIRRKASPVRTLVSIALGLPVGAAIVLTGSRGAVLGLAAGGLCLTLIAWRRLGRARRGAAVLGALLIVGAGGVVLIRRAGEADPFRYQRVAIWRASMQTVLAAPLTGSGPRQFALAARNLQFPDGDGPLRYDRGFSSTHSDLLRVPCELGWPAAAALLFFILALAQRLRVRHGESSLVDAEYAAIAALVALATQAIVDNLSQRPALYLLAAALIGTLASVVGPATRRLGRKTRLGLSLLLLVVFIVGDEGPYRAWRSLDRGAQGAQPAADALQEAIRLNPLHPVYARRLARSIAGDGSDWDLARYATARETAERAVRLGPRDSDGYWTLAQIEALACRTLFRDVASRERARHAFEQAETLSRYNAIIPVTLARFLLETGDAAGARRAAERAVALEPEAALPRLLLAEALLSGADPLGSARAGLLIAEAEERAARWADHVDTAPYAGELLRPGSGRFDRVRAMLDAMPAAPAG